MANPAPVRLTRNGNPPPSITLCYRGGYTRVDGSGLTDFERKQLEEKAQLVWDEAIAVFDKSNIKLKLSDLRIVEIDPSTGKEKLLFDFGRHDAVVHGTLAARLREDMIALAKLIRASFGNIRAHRPIGSNVRHPGDRKPFQIDREERLGIVERTKGRMKDRLTPNPLMQLSQMTVDKFLKKENFGPLHEAVTAKGPQPLTLWQEERSDCALNRIVAGEILIREFEKEVEKLIEEKRVAIKKLAKTDPFLKAEKGELRALKQLKQMIDERNRYAIFWAFGMADLMAQDDKEKKENAQEISEHLNGALVSCYGKDIGESRELVNYSKETGDLVLNNYEAYIERIEIGNSEDPSHTRGPKGPSIEEFFVHLMLDRKAIPRDSLTSLGMIFRDDLSKRLSAGLQAAVGCALNFQDYDAPAILGLDWETRAKELLKAAHF